MRRSARLQARTAQEAEPNDMITQDLITFNDDQALQPDVQVIDMGTSALTQTIRQLAGQQNAIDDLTDQLAGMSTQPRGEPCISHTKQYLDQEEATVRFQECLQQIPFHEMAWATGRNLPRLVYRYDPNAPLQAILTEMEETPPNIRVLDALIRRIEVESGRKIMGVFCNHYRDGSDYTPPHQDSYGFDVFTLSLGGSRDCHFHPLSGGPADKYTLMNGDLLFFNLAANEVYKHSIPKRASAEPRISLVFFAQ
jgi:alkylated DNA repair dioxygenase AlkB